MDTPESNVAVSGGPAGLPVEPPMGAPLVVIGNCEADQMVGDQTAHLASGTLQLFSKTPSPAPKLVGEDASETPTETPEGDVKNSALMLRIGGAAFSFESHLTTVFTHAENPRWYFFLLSFPSDSPDPSATSRPRSNSSAVGSGSYVRITLPEGVEIPGSALEKLRDAWEDILMGRGFLPDESASSPITSQLPNWFGSTPTPAAPASQPVEEESTMTGWATRTFARMSISLGERVVGLLGVNVADEAAISLPDSTPEFDAGSADQLPPVPPPDVDRKLPAIPPESADPTVDADGAKTDLDSAFILADSTSATSGLSTSQASPAPPNPNVLPEEPDSSLVAENPAKTTETDTASPIAKEATETKSAEETPSATTKPEESEAPAASS
ncbi:hypothetical protein DL93DRAFT_2093663 [Clavulina sp. PMI_390]|nr:hypothetical protein DL93DRAFT_2093663 [Clavulina sp. PMI_390]